MVIFHSYVSLREGNSMVIDFRFPQIDPHPRVPGLFGCPVEPRASFAPRLYLWYGERRDQCVGSQDDLQMMHMMLVMVMLVMCFLLLALMMMTTTTMMMMMMIMMMNMDLKRAENEDNDHGECDGDEM